MNMYELIMKKRDNGILSKEEIEFIIKDYTNEKIPDYQLSALLMAIYLNGMTAEETANMTHAMLHSGLVMNFDKANSYVIDKHSTGGVGDKLSLILGPIVASLGIHIPMIAGRGLGHTGGTLDKLEAIPGFSVDLTMEQFEQQVLNDYIAIIGQTKELAPADKKIYSLRDVTATVSSIPLITASIMSKKLAEGLNGLVMDVKYGEGAFMQEKDDAIALAKSIVSIGKHANTDVVAFLTNMNQPIGNYVGNWFEIIESCEALKGNGPKDTMEITLTLAAAMIQMAGKSKNFEDAKKLAQKQIDNGEAFSKFCEIVKKQGGDISYLKAYSKYPKAKFKIDVLAQKDGYLSKMNALKIGLLGVKIGAGREKISDHIDFTAGFILHKKVADKVQKGDLIAEIHYSKNFDESELMNQFNEALVYSDSSVEEEALILSMIDKNGNEVNF